MCFIFKCCCGLSCDCLEPAEDWNITNDIRQGEYGAGMYILLCTSTVSIYLSIYVNVSI